MKKSKHTLVLTKKQILKMAEKFSQKHCKTDFKTAFEKMKNGDYYSTTLEVELKKFGFLLDYKG
jgi:hypothetical protein